MYLEQVGWGTWLVVMGQSTKCCLFLQTTPFGFWWHRWRRETPLRLNPYNFTTLLLLKNSPSTETIIGQSTKCSPSTFRYFLQTTPFGFWWHRGRKETPLRLNLYNFTTILLLKNSPPTKTIMGQSTKCSPSTCCHSPAFLYKAGSYPAMIHYSNIQIDLCFSE